MSQIAGRHQQRWSGSGLLLPCDRYDWSFRAILKITQNLPKVHRPGLGSYLRRFGCAGLALFWRKALCPCCSASLLDSRSDYVLALQMLFCGTQAICGRTLTLRASMQTPIFRLRAKAKALLRKRYCSFGARSKTFSTRSKRSVSIWSSRGP